MLSVCLYSANEELGQSDLPESSLLIVSALCGSAYQSVIKSATSAVLCVSKSVLKV